MYKEKLFWALVNKRGKILLDRTQGFPMPCLYQLETTALSQRNKKYSLNKVYVTRVKVSFKI